MADIAYAAPEAVLDSVSTPINGASYDCNADGKLIVSHTHETGHYVQYQFRYLDYNSTVQLAAGEDGRVLIMYHDGSWHNVDWTDAGWMTNGVSYEFTIEFIGSTITVAIDGVPELSGECSYNSSVAQGHIYHDLVTNDIEITSYSLGGTPGASLSSVGSFGVSKAYFVRADGTAANKAAATGPEADASKCMSPSTHYSESFSPGDKIIISGLAGHIRGGFLFKGGSSSGRVSYEGRSNAVIDMTTAKTGWTNHAGNVWKATVAYEPRQIWIDGSYGDRKTALVGLVNEFDWFWDDPTNTLYLYAPGDPDTQYTNQGVEVPGEWATCECQNYCDVDSITIAKSRMYGFQGWNNSNVTLTNCDFSWNWWSGSHFGGDSAISNILIEDCRAYYNGTGGFGASPTASISNYIVRRCESFENGRFQYADPYWDEYQQYTFGIKIFNTATDCIIEQCSVHDNGPASPVGYGTWFGQGIWLDLALATAGHENIIRHNRVYGNHGVGLYCEITNYSIWHDNVVYNNANNTEAGVWSTSSIRCDARQGLTANYNKFYNNTIDGGLYGILCLTTDQIGGPTVSYNEFRNNIVVGYTGKALYADTGGDNDGANGTGNVYNANCFGPQATNFISWNATNYSTYDAWLAASSQTDNNVEVDPQFFNAGADQYWLADGSPCIDAGVNLGSPYNFGLQPSSVWPDAVATAEQGIFGSGWEIGAYVYPPTGGAVGDDTRHSRWFHLLTRRGHG